jgi:hypothetical protein
MPRMNKDQTEEMMARSFGSTSRARTLNLHLSRPKQTFYQREIMDETGLSLQTAQRESEDLICLGILEKREMKARVYN